MRRLLFALALVAGVGLLCRDTPEVTAQPKAAPVAVAPQAPTLNVAFPLGVQRGQTIELTLTGTNLADPTALWTSFPAKATFPTDMNNGKDAAKLQVKLEVPADAPIGFHSIRLATKQGISNVRMFCVDEAPADRRGGRQQDEGEGTASRACPAWSWAGQTPRSATSSRSTVKPGQRLTFEVIGRRLGSLLDPVIKLYDGKTGRETARPLQRRRARPAGRLPG